MLPVKGKSAGDVVIGGLRCQGCGAMYRPPKATRSVEVCDLCYLHLCYRERWPRLDTLRREGRA